MLNRINLIVRISMLGIVVLSILNWLFKWNLFAIPTIFFAIVNFFIIFTLTLMPSIIKKLNMKVSNGLYYLVLGTMLVSFVGGMVFKLYQIIPSYDTIVHFANGGIIAIVGFAFIRAQFENWREQLLLITIGAILISISIGAIWEIYEYVVDLITNGNMQRHHNIFPPGTYEAFVGQRALDDTMIDIIVDTLGAILGAFLMYRSVRKTEKMSKAFRLDHIK